MWITEWSLTMWVWFWIIVGILFGALCAYVAGEKRRSEGSWFVTGFFLGIAALIALAAIPSLSEEERQRREDEREREKQGREAKEERQRGADEQERQRRGRTQQREGMAVEGDDEELKEWREKMKRPTR